MAEPLPTRFCALPVYSRFSASTTVAVAALGVMDAVVVGGMVMSYLSLLGAVPLIVTVLSVPTSALLNVPVKFSVMLSSPTRSLSFQVMTSSASVLPTIYSRSLAVTMGVTAFFSALNVQEAETAP